MNLSADHDPAARVVVSFPEWQQALTSMGWVSPYPETLWQQLGGGESTSLGTAEVARLVSLNGWSADHADQLWRALQSPVSPPTAPTPDAHPLSPAPMPWEQAAQPAAASSPTTVPSTGGINIAFAGRRLLAASVDFLVWLVALLAVVSLGKLPVAVALGKQPLDGKAVTFLLCLLTVTALMALYFSWTMRRASRLGQSIGKQLAGLRVEADDGSSLSPSRLLIRQPLAVVLLPWLLLFAGNSIFWPLGFLFPVLLLGLALAGHALEDKLAKSRVV